MNPEMVAEHTPHWASRAHRHQAGVACILATPTTTAWASGLGVSAGGATEHMDQIFITAPPYPPSILLTGIIVNKLGQAVRRRGLLPLAHLGVRHWSSRTARRYLIVDEAHTGDARRCRWSR